MKDLLVDRDCVILDGRCDCPRPVHEHCKYITQGMIKRITEATGNMEDCSDQGVKNDAPPVPAAAGAGPY